MDRRTPRIAAHQDGKSLQFAAAHNLGRNQEVHRDIFSVDSFEEHAETKTRQSSQSLIFK